jgi:hypothetical protein
VQTDLAFPQSLAEKYRPTRIADFVGLDRPKKVLTAFSKRPASGAKHGVLRFPDGTRL